LINEKIKQIVEGFLNSVKLPAILIGTYNGTGVQIDERFMIPSAQLSGNMKALLKTGDKFVYLHRRGGMNFISLK
jgi:hypothetical protein